MVRLRRHLLRDVPLHLKSDGRTEAQPPASGQTGSHCIRRHELSDAPQRTRRKRRPPNQEHAHRPGLTPGTAKCREARVMKHQQIDQYAAKISAEKRSAVYDGTKAGYDSRKKALFTHYAAPDDLRRLAGQIKQHAIENLDTYLPQVEAKLQANGARVHWAENSHEACQRVLEIMRSRNATKIVKAKTMVSEEIGLTPYLEAEGIECLETDLGEFIIQIAHDHPSHIVKPIIHKNRREIAKLFEENGLGDYNDDPEII